MPPDPLPPLRKAIAGLLYPSEKDVAFLPFHWQKAEKIDAPAILQQLGLPKDEPVEESTLAAFFKPLTTEHAWHGQDEKARVKKFLALEQTLKDNLKGLRVFKIGKARKKVVLVGKSSTGQLAGLLTEALET